MQPIADDAWDLSDSAVPTVPAVDFPLGEGGSRRGFRVHRLYPNRAAKGKGTGPSCGMAMDRRACQNDDGQNDGGDWIGDMPIELELPVVRSWQDEFDANDKIFTGLWSAPNGATSTTT